MQECFLIICTQAYLKCLQPRRPTSTKAQNNHANLKKKGDVTYKVIVTTGNKKNAGTDAKVQSEKKHACNI